MWGGHHEVGWSIEGIVGKRQSPILSLGQSHGRCVEISPSTLSDMSKKNLSGLILLAQFASAHLPHKTLYMLFTILTVRKLKINLVFHSGPERWSVSREELCTDSLFHLQMQQVHLMSAEKKKKIIKIRTSSSALV